jgi:hypothetical protein
MRRWWWFDIGAETHWGKNARYLTRAYSLTSNYFPMEKIKNVFKILSKEEQKKIVGGDNCILYDHGHTCRQYAECEYDLPLCEPI